MRRRTFLATSAAAAGAALFEKSAAAGADSRPDKPNIVFIFPDQLRAQSLGCYGDGDAITPNIDRLASEGVRFSNATSTLPVCSPFRAMLLTGRYPMANGTVANDTAVKDGLPTIATVCRENGYATGYIGKWHLEWERDPFVPKERRQGFEYWAVRSCAHDYFDSFYCGDTPEHIPLEGYEPIAQTDLAEAYIERHKDEPFCLFMSWGPPHGPYMAPPAYMERFPRDAFKLRPNVSERAIVKDLLATDSSELSSELAERRRAYRATLDNEEALREWIQGYYAATCVLDECMGRVMGALERAGIADHTILVFASDHGDMLGSHGMASKQMPLAESINIPFILRYPRAVAAGTVTDALLAPIDIMPTLLGLAGLPCPGSVDGVNLAHAAQGKSGEERDALLLMKMLPGGNPWIANGVREWRGVRTKRYTYARLLDRGPWLLYDNEADPYQMRNLATDADQAERIRQFESRMAELLEEANDPVDPAVIKAYRDDRRK
jgi:arylsulfatase A-like enzyme